jgi:hypothetical protein
MFAAAVCSLAASPPLELRNESQSPPVPILPDGVWPEGPAEAADCVGADGSTFFSLPERRGLWAGMAPGGSIGTPPNSPPILLTDGLRTSSLSPSALSASGALAQGNDAVGAGAGGSANPNSPPSELGSTEGSSSQSNDVVVAAGFFASSSSPSPSPSSCFCPQGSEAPGRGAVKSQQRQGARGVSVGERETRER